MREYAGFAVAPPGDEAVVVTVPPPDTPVAAEHVSVYVRVPLLLDHVPVKPLGNAATLPATVCGVDVTEMTPFEPKFAFVASVAVPSAVP